MIKIWKSEDANFIYIGTVASSVTEDFEYVRSGDYFSINRKNTVIPEVVRLKYDNVEGKDVNGDSLMFTTPQDLEDYFANIFTQNVSTGSGFFPSPIIEEVESNTFNQGETKTITIKGSYFTLGTTVTVAGLVVTNVNVISAHELTADVTSLSVDANYPITVTNESGSTTQAIGIIVALSTWTDLRLGGDILVEGSDIRVRTGMTITRDTTGMFFSGLAPWGSWVKIEKLAWTRGDNKTCQWIFNTPSSNIMIGIGSTATDEANNAQYTQNETLAYFQNSTTMWGLYGNNGTPGGTGNQSNSQSIAGSTGFYKIKFEADGGAGGTFTLFSIPSGDSGDWDDETTVLRTFTIAGTLNPDEPNLMPVVIPQNAGTQRFIAVKVD